MFFLDEMTIACVKVTANAYPIYSENEFALKINSN